MVPFRLKPQQFAERYRRSLERASEAAIAALRLHLKQPVEADVERVEVQIFVGDEDPHAPSFWVYCLGQHNKVDPADSSLHAGRALELELGLERLEAFDPRFFSDEAFGGVDIAADALKAWFAECWWKAGGWDYLPTASLHVHDGYGDGKLVKLTER